MSGFAKIPGVGPGRGFGWRVWRDRRATTALEFAMIGPVFFLFIFAVFVVSLDMFMQMVLDDAVRNAARQIEAGTVTSGSQFVSAVCGEFGLLAPGCAARLQYSVTTSQSYATAAPASLSAAGVLSGSGMYNVAHYVAAQTGTTTPILAQPEYLLVQVAFVPGFRIFIVPNGVATGSGTAALYAVAAAPMES